MGLLTDIIKEIPHTAVLKEKIAAVEAKYAATETENAILKDDLRQANMLIEELKQQVKELTHKDGLDEMELNLLHGIANLAYDIAVPEVFSQGFEGSKARFEYHLQRLKDFDYVRSGVIDSRGVHYEVTQLGRTLLLEKNLL